MIINEENGGLVVNYARLQARYWADTGFGRQLAENPNETLKQFGIDYGVGVEAEIVLNTDNVAYFIIPSRPARLSDHQVSELAAAGTFGTAGSVGSAGTICGCAACFGTLGTFGCADL
jgi:hypothetical protein